MVGWVQPQGRVCAGRGGAALRLEAVYPPVPPSAHLVLALTWGQLCTPRGQSAASEAWGRASALSHHSSTPAMLCSRPCLSTEHIRQVHFPGKNLFLKMLTFLPKPTAVFLRDLQSLGNPWKERRCLAQLPVLPPKPPALLPGWNLPTLPPGRAGQGRGPRAPWGL